MARHIILGKIGLIYFGKDRKPSFNLTMAKDDPDIGEIKTRSNNFDDADDR